MLNKKPKMKLVAASIASAVAVTACVGGPSLTRIATVPLGAEVTGIYKTDNGDLFFNVQHPSDSLPAPENSAAVGVWTGVDFNNLPADFPEIGVPTSGSAFEQITRVSEGSFQVLGRAGDTYAGALPFGLGAVVTADGTASIKLSQDPDFNAYIPNSVDGNSGYLFSAWEDRPGAMSRLAVNKLADGSWQVSDAMNVDFSGVKGTMINCFGTVSPWGTPLTSEENYEAENAANWNNPAYSSGYPNYPDVLNIQTYLGGEFPNPYNYGYIVEITEPTSANPTPVKLFTLGRSAHENAVIMPDEKTVYLTDDGTDKGFYKFVAREAGDLSAGTLYAAKVFQDPGSDAATTGFDIAWLELGSGSNEEIAGWIAEYDGIDESDYVEGETSYITDAEISDWAAGLGGDDRYAFLETLKAAEAKGATVEFRKMEGININYAGVADGSIPFMYVAMSEVRRGMTDTEGDIQVSENRCGIVYQLSLDENFNADRMDPLVIGGNYDSAAAENKCPVDAIANPDNLIVLDDGRLIIGEDTSKHKNNMIWLYDAN
ncbi:MAG: PhoX family protein [Pseudomonadales bacterium]|nr:PhoX family protein [Pseudomonadales bacterium]